MPPALVDTGYLQEKRNHRRLRGVWGEENGSQGSDLQCKVPLEFPSVSLCCPPFSFPPQLLSRVQRDPAGLKHSDIPMSHVHGFFACIFILKADGEAICQKK